MEFCATVMRLPRSLCQLPQRYKLRMVARLPMGVIKSG